MATKAFHRPLMEAYGAVCARVRTIPVNFKLWGRDHTKQHEEHHRSPPGSADALASICKYAVASIYVLGASWGAHGGISVVFWSSESVFEEI